MNPPMRAPRRAGRPSRWTTWSPLLVLGGSAVTATLLIQLGLSALGPASPFIEGERTAAAAPRPVVPLDTQVAVAAAPRER